ncbi:MAG: hypothetical protein AAF212_03960 [Verrucomicrobiota bacterium]
MNPRFKFYGIVILTFAIWHSSLRWHVIPPSIRLEDYAFTKMEVFELEAKILSKKNYHWGKESALAPVDLALGWGRMADPKIIDQIEVSQANRWYKLRIKDHPPIPMREIQSHSANMHMIPANEEALKSLVRLKEGMNIKLSGHLVWVSGKKVGNGRVLSRERTQAMGHVKSSSSNQSNRLNRR